ncbi:MAG: hypothetical protein Q7U36_00935 [bacterium]|nr:hypothetical protein [bacterium]
MHSLGKWLLLILFALAFVEFSAKPSAEEKIIIEMNSIHTEIMKNKAMFNEMRYDPKYSIASINEMGCDLNFFITLFNEKLGDLLLSPYFKKKKFLPREISLLEINCP